MFLAHSFRLRDPWQCERLGDGATRWSRVFHRPTGLEPDDALWLVIAGLPENAAVSLNGQPLCPSDISQRATSVLPARATESSSPSPEGDATNQFEVTSLLGDANRIEILLPSDPRSPVSGRQSGSFPYDARLAVVGHS
jgi:hypothetical protein